MPSGAATSRQGFRAGATLRYLLESVGPTDVGWRVGQRLHRKELKPLKGTGSKQANIDQIPHGKELSENKGEDQSTSTVGKLSSLVAQEKLYS